MKHRGVLRRSFVVTVGIVLLLLTLVIFADTYLERFIPIESFQVPVVSSVPSRTPAITPNLSVPSITPPLTPALSSFSRSVVLDVPFLVQAPFAKWDALHEDACEEASLINVKHFLDKKAMIDKTEGENEIQALVAFQSAHGYGASITVQQLSEIARDYYGLKTGRVETNVTIETIKKELRNSKPVIVGAAGKILPNPFFKNNGPNYHMLVIKGYDDNGTVPLNKCKRIDTDSCKQTPGVFITNDVGISQGNNFRYTYDALFKAIHNWDPTNILNGQKAYLVFD